MNLRGETMQQVSVIGAGFSCIDIIKLGESTTYDLGGTAANVMCILSQLGMRTSLLVPHYGDQYADDFIGELRHRKVNVIEFKCSKTDTPRIVERCAAHGTHSFETVCSKCGSNLNRVALPTTADIENLGNGLWEGSNAFFFDRISGGIKTCIQKARRARAWTYYEPNSCRQYSAFCNNAAEIDIVKFSEDRVPMSFADRLLVDLDEKAQTKLIIVSQGEKGLKFSLRPEHGHFGDWSYLEADPLPNAVDASGAGDWLAAVFLWHFLREFPHVQHRLPSSQVEGFLRNAQIIAAHSCLHIGAQGIFKSSESVAFLNQYFNCNVSMFAELNIRGAGNNICKNCLKPLQSP